MTQFKYRSDVDGLRAVAVLLVLFFHAGLGFTGGYVGVDVFFVISGFLITGLILKEQETDRFKLTNFWLRRVRRIIPAASVMTLLTLIAGALLMLPADYHRLSASAVAQQFIAANFYFFLKTDYFDGPAETMALLHTWSLAVEEQYYLFFPFLMAFLGRFKRSVMFSTLLVIGLLSLALSQWAVSLYPKFTFFLLPARAWELVIGGLIWFVPGPKKINLVVLELLSWASLAVIGLTAWFYSAATTFPGITAMAPCLAATVLIYCNGDRLTTAGKLLSLKAVVFIGLISYSLYLYHWPIMAFMRYWSGNHLSVSNGLIAIAGSFVLAILSWRYVETPFRTKWKSASTFRTFGVAIASIVVLLVLAGGIYGTRGLPQRIPAEHRQAAAGMSAAFDYVNLTPDQIREGQVPLIGSKAPGEEPIRFLLWGDSHAHAMQGCFYESATEAGLNGTVVTKGGCMPLVGITRPNDPAFAEMLPKRNDAVLDYIRAFDIQHVFLVARWSSCVEGRPGGIGQELTLIGKEGTTFADKAMARAGLEHGLEQTLAALNEEGVNVWIFKQVPEQHVAPQRRIVKSLVLNQDMPAGSTRREHEARQANANRIIDEVVSKYPGVTVVDLSQDMFDANGNTVLGNPQGSFYRDTHHLSEFGTQHFFKTLMDQLFADIDHHEE